MSRGDKIRELRKEWDLNQKQVAERSGIAQGYISALENDRYIPTRGTIQRLAPVFDMSTAELAVALDEAAEEDNVAEIADDAPPDRERILLEKFRQLDIDDQDIVLAFLAALEASGSPEAAAKGVALWQVIRAADKERRAAGEQQKGPSGPQQEPREDAK